MLIEAIYHQSMSNYCYAYDADTVNIRIRTARNDFTQLKVLYKDKFDWSQNGVIDMIHELSDDQYDYYSAKVPMIRRLTYYFYLKGKDTEIYYTQSGVVKNVDDNLSYKYCFQYPYIFGSEIQTTPEWVRNTVFYEIFPDRFCTSSSAQNRHEIQTWGSKPEWNNFFGGDLEGIISKIDYLKDLGISGIYLTPVFKSDSNHKYDTIDYYEIDPDFGDLATLRKLVKICHNKGIKVILDGVFNHCSYKMKQFQDVLQNGMNSIYFDWFCYKDNGHEKDKTGYETYSVMPDMPKLNTSNNEVQEYLLSVATYWVLKANIDGWRLDVGDELSQVFLRRLRDKLKSYNNNIYIVGECWYNGYPWLMGDQFDGIMNYQLKNICENYFAEGMINTDQFRNSVSRIRTQYSNIVNEVNMNLLDSHDTPRFLTRCGNDSKRLLNALTFLLTYDGTPCIYYGTETGMTGGNDPDCRKCFDWNMGQWDMHIYTFTKALINLRNRSDCLRKGDFRWLEDKELVVYERSYRAERVVIIINSNNEPKKFRLGKESSEYVDLLTQDSLHGTFIVPESSSRIVMEK